MDEPDGLEADDRDAGFDRPVSESITRALPPLPTPSRIRVLESTDERLLLFIPAGGQQARAIGWFALIWNVFIGIFTAVLIGGAFGAAGKQPDSPAKMLMAMLAVFWIVGLGLAYGWLKMRFERTFILLERERLVVQRLLFGRRKLQEATLTAASRAELVEAYQQNERPVYRIELSGETGSIGFGTALDNPEKDWVIERINDFLGVSPPAAELADGSTQPVQLQYPDECDECAALLRGEPVDGALKCLQCGTSHAGWSVPQHASLDAEVDAESESASDELLEPAFDVVESDSERLKIALKHGARPRARFFARLFGIPFLVVVVAGLVYIVRDIGPGQGMLGVLGAIFSLLHFLPFVLIGGALVGLTLYVLFGRSEIELTRESLTCRWHVGPFRYARSLPTGSIVSVSAVSLSRPMRPAPRHVRQSAPTARSYTCVVRGNGRMIPLTWLQSNTCSKEVAALVRGKLTEWGTLPNYG